MGPNGMAYGAEIGKDIKDTWRPSQESRESYTYFKHTMELNDVLISAMLLHKADPRFMLDSLRHERYLVKHPQSFVWNGTKFKLIPDAMLKFQTPAGPRTMLIEHETWSQHQTKFKRKIRKYIAMLQNEAWRAPIAFTTFRGNEHVLHMRQWALEELTILHQPPTIGVYFRFTSLEKPLNPATVWLSARWQTPYDEAPQTALAA
jgi:Replication-relaxation